VFVAGKAGAEGRKLLSPRLIKPAVNSVDRGFFHRGAFKRKSLYIVGKNKILHNMKKKID
jgi:hypothetical protein